MRSDLQRVSFSGGHLAGAVLALPPDVAARVARLDLAVTPGGQVYDRKAKRIVRGAEVVERPDAQRINPPSRRRITRPGRDA